MTTRMPAFRIPKNLPNTIAGVPSKYITILMVVKKSKSEVVERPYGLRKRVSSEQFRLFDIHASMLSC